MKKSIPFVLTLTTLLTPEAGAETWWRVFGEIKPGTFAGGHHESEAGDPVELEAMLKQTRFDEWVTHEDEFVRISYPKHPLLKLEIQGDNSGIRVEGGVCTTVDNSFEKAYVLKAGSATYGVFLLNPAPWLDDGICFCGPMVHHVYRYEDGCLARFSLLPGGAVKKAQLLGDKLRLMAFEWTHLACPRPIYEEMVERMTLKIRHPLDEAALRREIQHRYGEIGLSGWIHPGARIKDAASIMGSEPAMEDGIATWKFDANDYHFALRARVKDGSIEALLDEGPNPVSEQPIEGTLRWGDWFLRSIEESGEKPTKEQIQQIVDVVVKAAAAPDSNARIGQWLPLLHELVTEHGARHDSIVPTTLRAGTGTKEELGILTRLGYPEVAGWVSGSLDKMVAERPSQEPDEPFVSAVEWRGRCASDLLEWLMDNQHEEVATSKLRALLDTGEPAWILAGVECAPRLPAEFAQSVVRKGLESAIKEEDGDLVEACFSAIESAKLADPATLIPIVEKFPEGEPESDWATRRQRALAALRKPKE